MIGMALLLVGLQGFVGTWWIYFFRFILLFSAIIPISLRVNMDMGKTAYSFMVSELLNLRRTFPEKSYFI